MPGTSSPSGLSAKLLGAARFVYLEAVRPLLPLAEPVRLNGIPLARRRKLGDVALHDAFGPFEQDQPTYEAPLVAGLRQHVRKGDKIVVIGGGVGITAVVAAIETGPTGAVICYEASADQFEEVKRTVAANGLADRIEVRHAVVGEAIGVYGLSAYGDVLAPRDLPACDILEMDCEGAEVMIMRDLPFRPRVCLIETHGELGSTSAAMTARLEGMGYRVENLGPAEPTLAEHCLKNDIVVLSGVRTDAA